MCRINKNLFRADRQSSYDIKIHEVFNISRLKTINVLHIKDLLHIVYS